MRISYQHSSVTLYMVILLTAVGANIPKLRNCEYDANMNMNGLENYYMSSIEDPPQYFLNPLYYTTRLNLNLDESNLQDHQKTPEEITFGPFPDWVNIIRQPGPNNREVISLDISPNANLQNYSELTRDKHNVDVIERKMKEMDLAENPDLLVALFLNILKESYPDKLKEMKEILNKLTNTKTISSVLQANSTFKKRLPIESSGNEILPAMKQVTMAMISGGGGGGGGADNSSYEKNLQKSNQEKDDDNSEEYDDSNDDPDPVLMDTESIEESLNTVNYNHLLINESNANEDGENQNYKFNLNITSERYLALQQTEDHVAANEITATDYVTYKKKQQLTNSQPLTNTLDTDIPELTPDYKHIDISTLIKENKNSLIQKSTQINKKILAATTEPIVTNDLDKIRTTNNYLKAIFNKKKKLKFRNRNRNINLDVTKNAQSRKNKFKNYY